MKRYSLNKWPIPFHIRLEIGRVLLKDNPDHGKGIVAWVLSQDSETAIRAQQSSPGTMQSEMK